MPAKLWKHLTPDPEMVRALNEADKVLPRATAVTGKDAERRKWSNALADACARMVANAVRANDRFTKLHVLPKEKGKAEPRTFIARGQRKRVDVVISSTVSGLQVGISLKGMNFRDGDGWQFDKNLTGRTYELRDEFRVIHEYQPASLLVALYMLPIAATVDKKDDQTPSSFARTVQHLRARTSRVDPTLPGQYANADMSFVALYVPGDVESDYNYRDTVRRGVVRYFDVIENPPMRGRPRVETTLSLADVVEKIAERWATQDDVPITWARPEND